MQNPRSDAYDCLNDEDRAAIEWLFNQVFEARDAMETVRRELHDTRNKAYEVKKAFEAAIVPLLKTIN